MSNKIDSIRRFGLIGYPLSHSFSEKYFTEKFQKENIRNCKYETFSIENIELLNNLLNTHEDLVGLNVTIPYKEQVLSYLDDVDEDAKDIGAVNTIRISRKGTRRLLKGFNTDVYGFKKPLLGVLKPHHTNALILGTGGASKAVAWVLTSLGISYSYVSRKPTTNKDYAYEQLTPEIISKHSIVVNTSPIGMYPNIDQAPNIPYSGITGNHILYDLVYNPLKTVFLKKGEEKKATLINGLPMLHLQAEKAWEIWNK